MGSDNTSNVEVKSQKSRKRTKKKDKSADFVNKGNCETNATENDIDQIKETNRQNASKKHKEKKHKSKRNHNANTETAENDERENNLTQKEDEEDLDGEAPPKKLQKSNQENTEETQKTNAKGSKAPSKRQLKREKAEKKENEKKEASRLEAMKKGLNYVSKWKHARSEWKFEKLRQIWLMDNLLDDTSIPDDIFPTVLEYFEGCKGMAREQLLKKGMDVIRKVEEDEENKEEMESVAYQRARKLLQALPTEM